MLRHVPIFAPLSIALGLLAGCDGVSPPGMTPPAPAAASASQPAAGAETTPSSRPTGQVPSAASAVPGATTEADPRIAVFAGVRGPKPVKWLFRPTSSAMRAANYTVPGQDGSDAAEIVVFAFGPGQGGGIEDNIQRWASQFRSPEGGPVEPIITELETSIPTTLIELRGDWQPTGQGWFSKAQTGLFAIVDPPSGRLFIRLGGPSPTVEANRSAFMAMLLGLESVSDPASEGSSD